MATLAVKYRPQTFEDVCGQENIIQILNNQLQHNSFKQVYLFTGPSGCGKTTLARIFAKKLNNGGGSIIEIDAASNNGVDDVRTIIEDSKYLPLDGKYKVYLLDEVHLFSAGAWGAMLKLIEEPPIRTIFIFCTTDPHKIPATILSRMQRYDFAKLSSTQIIQRLKHILQQENIQQYDEGALQLIVKTAKGGMRDGVALLEKCLDFNNILTTESVSCALGVISFEKFIGLIQAIQEKQGSKVLSILNEAYESGVDMKLFVVDLLNFILGLVKYKLTQDYTSSGLPLGYQEQCASLKFKQEQLIELVEGLTKLYYNIKYESNPIVFIQAFLLRVSL